METLLVHPDCYEKFDELNLKMKDIEDVKKVKLPNKFSKFYKFYENEKLVLRVVDAEVALYITNVELKNPNLHVECRTLDATRKMTGI